MTSRYGRNQRRAHREQIAKLERDVSSAQWRASSAEGRLRDARQEAMRELVKSEPYVKEAMNRLGYELGRAMGPHFQPHVEKLMAMDQRRRSEAHIAFDASIRADQMTVSYIEGRIEPIVYRVAFANLGR